MKFFVGFCVGVTAFIAGLMGLAALEEWARHQRYIIDHGVVLPPNWQKLRGAEPWGSGFFRWFR